MSAIPPINGGSALTKENQPPQEVLRCMSNGIETLLTSKGASRVLKIHPKVLERMAKRGDVPALKVG